MSRKISWLLTLPLLWLACKAPENPEEARPAQEARLDPYDLNVVLRGLVAVVPQADDEAWALLVDAEYDPMLELVAIDDLPPCAADDLCGGTCNVVRTAIALDDFPPHYAYMRIRNAKVDGVPKELLVPMAGTDLRINPDRAGGSAALGLLASSEDMQQARCDPNQCDTSQCDAAQGCRIDPDPEPLDQVGSAFLDPDPAVALAQPALSGRVLLQLAAGDQLVAKKDCTTNHSFASRTDSSCDNAQIDLADETILTHKGLTNPTKLVFKESGEELRLEPIHTGGKIEIIIGNQVASAIFHPDSIKLCQGKGHPKGFRWLYRFSTSAGQADCSDHYYPCVLSFAGRKCPQKILTP